ncbi:U6 small nuclear RNA (adenine-(43)-N(6))-methyltransferase isoform X1 [Olea europaea var. sylvestris]|uniref:U6 small nuclear RNA (adenine-(43)-N(6))-methyltransferase isoform X1 n=1 Tax=Olea europaea var. sylvestris TaxID=158386 RepID=UPI000C1D1744|nr:U6 small nuclear RNA (adenine-(43)-N(6))-methyltransferase isoform X1 [Olea europaea var. sylvestris]
MPSKKRRKRGGERRVIHPRNKYSENPPDFGLLASLYPSFEPYVFYSLDGRPRIDWTDFNATRELTRVLLLHDHGLNWWIPDGQLCPTVPNRSNYIHWIEDLLASDLIPCTRGNSVVKGFDIGTGANCIYPLLGASLLGWTFVGSDVTDVAIEWANRNVKSNPHLSELIEIRRVDTETKIFDAEELQNKQKDNINSYVDSTNTVSVDMGPSPSFSLRSQSVKNSYHGPPVLVGVVKDGESFDFCMCNPPFFMTMEEAGLNPKTSCGGTPEEMVCLGGEEAFITRIIEDSAQLKRAFRWYTSMVGRKSNLNILTSKLWNVGVTVVKTTEFVQGQTSRWGLAWSFMPPSRKMLFSHVTEKKNLSFMLEGLQRQHSAFHVLQSVESFFCSCGASCKLNASTFNIDITASQNHCNTILKSETQNENEAVQCKNELEISRTSNDNNCQSDDLQFRISVFQQIPGTLLVRSTLHQKESSSSGLFSLIFKQLEKVLKNKFCTERVSADGSCSNLRR